MGNLEPTNLLDDAMLDLALCRIKYQAHSDAYIWKRFIRE